MNLVNWISEKITQYIVDILNEDSEEEISKIYYGMYVLIFNILKILLIFIIAIFLNIFNYVFITFITFGIIRTYANGVHLSSPLICLIITGCIYILPVYIAFAYVLNNFIITIIFIINFVILFKYAPSDTESKPIVSVDLRRQLKFNSLIVITLLYIFAIICNVPFIGTIIAITSFISCLMVLPLTYKLLNRRYNNYEQI